MNKIKSVGIIGCGWLGTALAEKLQQQAISVCATRSNDANSQALNEQGISAQTLLLPAAQQVVNQHSIFKQQCIIIAITPQFRHGRVDYADKVNQLVMACQQSQNVKQVILLSSTAVYNGLSGEVDETANLDYNADKVALLSKAEQCVLNINLKLNHQQSNNQQSKYQRDQKEKGDDIDAYVLRLSGLVGPKRHPGKFLLHGRTLKNPDAKVNLIHQHDAVGLLMSLINEQPETGIYNGVSEYHPVKREYYQVAASALNMTAPVFEESQHHDIDSKCVLGEKVSAKLAYQFIYPNLLTWLKLNQQ